MPCLASLESFCEIGSLGMKIYTFHGLQGGQASKLENGDIKYGKQLECIKVGSWGRFLLELFLHSYSSIKPFPASKLL